MKSTSNQAATESQVLPNSIPIPKIDPKLLEAATTTHRDLMLVKVNSAESSAEAQGSLTKIKQRIEELTEMRMAITRPMDAAKKLIMALFATPIMRYEQAADHLSQQVIAWDTKVKAEAAAAQKKLDDAAEKKRLKLQEQADAAERAGNSEKASKLLDKADSVVAPIVTADLPQVRGSSIVKRWAFEIKDPKSVAPECMTPDLTKIGKLVRSLGLDAQKTVGPGVRIYEDKSVRSW